MTNAYVDDVDLFLERVDPADSSRYLTPKGSRPFEVVAETIQVKGWEAPEVLEVRKTRHGPVLPIQEEASGDTLLALQWTALDPTTVFRGVIGLNFAASWDEFLAAIDDMDDPHQNLVYADTAGHIGYIMGGTVPIRGDRRPAPVAPRPGWTGEYDWQGSIPFTEHPRAFDPPAGYIVTANNRQVAGPLADLISQTWLQPFRAMRITELIRDGSPPYAPEDVLRMQLDLLDLNAERYVVRAIEAAEQAELPEAAEMLRGWDRRASPESRAATLFYVWNEIVRRALATDLHDGPPAYFPRATASLVLDRKAVPWAEEPGPAYRRIVDTAIRDAAALADRPWSEANRAVHSHALGDVAILNRILGLNIGPAPHYGAPTTVNVAHWGFQRPADDFPFTTTAGPSMRQVIDLGNTDGGGGFVIPTGQSGLPFDEHYADQTSAWHDGGLLQLPLVREAVDRLTEQRLTLDPDTGNDRR
jgi:penicillin amidase